jgi:hypothetical protein
VGVVGRTDLVAGGQEDVRWERCHWGLARVGSCVQLGNDPHKALLLENSQGMVVESVIHYDRGLELVIY